MAWVAASTTEPAAGVCASAGADGVNNSKAATMDGFNPGFMCGLRIEGLQIVLSSLRANGSRECAPDDKLREAIHCCEKEKAWIASSLRSSQ
jgi:hypothetical protein